METQELNFTSKPCTNHDQSKRLIAMGLKSETADCHVFNCSTKGKYYQDGWRISADPYSNVIKAWNKFAKDSSWGIIPAWSLDRLRELMPKHIDEYFWVLFQDSIGYICLENGQLLVSFNGDPFESSIQMFEWLIKEGHIDKKYLKSEFVKVEINTLANKCGFFNGETDVNNGYGCNHPEQEVQDESEDERGHRICQGKCLASTCPLGWLDDENMENDFVQMSRGDALKLGLTDYDVDEVEEK